MTVYKIIRHKDKGIHPYPYAITKDKKLKNKFLEQRDSSKFEVIKEQVSSHADLPTNYNDLYLVERELYSKEGHVKLILTGKEDMDCTLKAEDIVPEEMSKYISVPLFSFSKKVIDALNMLGYGFFATFNPNTHDRYFISSSNFCNYKIDELSVFLKLYGWTLKQ